MVFEELKADDPIPPLSSAFYDALHQYVIHILRVVLEELPLQHNRELLHQRTRLHPPLEVELIHLRGGCSQARTELLHGNCTITELVEGFLQHVICGLLGFVVLAVLDSDEPREVLERVSLWSLKGLHRIFEYLPLPDRTECVHLHPLKYPEHNKYTVY